MVCVVFDRLEAKVARSRGVRGPYRWLDPSERREIERLVRDGVAPKEIAARFASSVTTVYRIAGELVMSRRRVSHSRFRLSFEERVEIAVRIGRGESASEIARGLGRHRSTIGREIGRCGKRGHYQPFSAERKAQKLARRPKPTKLSGSPRLLAEVEAGLERCWSPRQISARLKLEHPDDQELRISPETIYQSLFVQGRGELRRQLARHLRSGRTKRRPRPQGLERRGRIADMVPISQRPAEVEDRAVPGHWEGDLLIGKGQHSAIATLVERHTRYVMLAYLGRDRTTEHVTWALKQRIQTLPKHLVQSLTWDQGPELAAHKQFSVDTGVKVYFCDPHSPWQRGSNENTNRLLRQYLPKNTDLAARDQAELDHIAAELNGRPRQTLGWLTPAEKMQQLLLR
jgi:IS30 family transposase